MSKTWICIRHIGDRWWVTEEEGTPEPIDYEKAVSFPAYGNALFFAHEIAKKYQAVSLWGEEWIDKESAES